MLVDRARNLHMVKSPLKDEINIMRHLRFTRFLNYLVLALALAGISCSGQKLGESNGSTAIGGTVHLQGSGASFPKPIYEKWVNEFGKIHSDVQIDYQSTGSGAGQKALIAKTADFGASDDPMSDQDMTASGNEILHIPTVLGAVVMTYNLEGLKQPLKLSGQTIADIYLGKIKKWNDERLKADNPNAELPDIEILPVYRADSSGTSAVFTDFLSKTVAEWKEKVGMNKQPSWITGVGIGAKGNDGVMGQVKQTPNSIGYVELTFAKANNLPTAHIRNKSGNFVDANLETVAAAAADSTSSMPADLRMQLTNAEGNNSYPIASYTYILVFKNQPDASKGKALADFLYWAVTDGEAFVKDLHYAPLPSDVVAKVKTKINSIENNGKSFRN